MTVKANAPFNFTQLPRNLAIKPTALLKNARDDLAKSRLSKPEKSHQKLRLDAVFGIKKMQFSHEWRGIKVTCVVL